MSFQNRVDPFGNIQAVSERGTFMGNRGRLHDPATQTLFTRRWTLKAWLICLTDFNNRQRKVMGHSYTELFFLDEVTALAAGHRPCFECRRRSAKAYQAAWQQAYELSQPPKIAIMDPQLHSERLAAGKKRKHLIPTQKLPNGAIIEYKNTLYAFKDEVFFTWSFSGYNRTELIQDDLPDTVSCLTPPSSLAVLANNYEPVWHESIYRQHS